MSTAQVQRLEDLLARVQQNRQARAESTVVTPMPFATMELAEPAFAAASPPIAATKQQPVVSMKPAPVAAPAPKPAPQPVAKKNPDVAVARSIPVANVAPSANAPARVVTSPAPPSAPIALATSPHPVMDGPSFGELLRRSLALRPR